MGGDAPVVIEIAVIGWERAVGLDEILPVAGTGRPLVALAGTPVILLA